MGWVGKTKQTRFMFYKFCVAIALSPIAATEWKDSLVYLVLLSQITWVDSAFSNWRESLREEKEN